jgi:cytidine deaminase
MNKRLDEMFVLAKKAREHAHAPYSKFKVGCCIRTTNNLLFVGANVEVIAFPSSQCAEGSAVGSMVASGEKEINEILIVADGKLFCSPCGNCRQVIAEFGNKNTLVHVCDLNGIKKTVKLCKLLPYGFGRNF